MSDLAKRLKLDFSKDSLNGVVLQMRVYSEERYEAALRIEKLEEALKKIERENTFPPTIANEVGRKYGPFAVIARAALGEEKDGQG